MKAVLIIDIDEKYIGAIGTEIQFANRKYNCKWELKPMPKRKNEYTDIDAVGWNKCLEEIERGDRK